MSDPVRNILKMLGHIYSDTGLQAEEMAITPEENFYIQDSDDEDDESYWEEDTAHDINTIALNKDLLAAAPFIEGQAETKAFFYIGEQSFNEVDDPEAENESFSTASISYLKHVWEQIERLENGQEPPDTLVTEMVNIFRDLGRSAPEIEESLINYNDFLNQKVCRMISEMEKDNEQVSCVYNADDKNELHEELKQLEKIKRRNKQAWRIACRKGNYLHKKLLIRNSLKSTLVDEIKWKTEIEQEVEKLHRQTADMVQRTRLPQVLKIPQGTSSNEGGATTSFLPMFHERNRKQDGSTPVNEASESAGLVRLELPKLK